MCVRVFLCSVVLCRYRPCVGLIPRPRSPTKCLNMIHKFQGIISEPEQVKRTNPRKTATATTTTTTMMIMMIMSKLSLTFHVQITATSSVYCTGECNLHYDIFLPVEGICKYVQ
jgi:hypothetical protein